MTPAGPGDSSSGRASGAGATGFWLYAGQVLSVFGIALSNILLGLSVLASPWLVRRRDGAPIPWRRAAPVLLPLLVYVLLFLGAVAWSLEPSTSADALGELLSLTVLPLGFLLVRGERRARLLVDLLTVAGALFAAYGLAQYLAGFGGIDQRIRGPFSHWMTFSGILLVVDLLLVARMVLGGAWRGWPGAWRWVALVLINWALLGSLTRSAWVGLAVALVVFALVRSPRWLAAAAPILLLAVLVVPVPLLARAMSIVDLSNPSNYDRLCMVEAGLHMVADRPLTGLGPEMVEPLYPLYRHPSAPRLWVPHLHNTYLDQAAERGIPALLAYLWLLGASATLAWRRLRREGGLDGPRADLLVGQLLALLGFAVAGLFEHNWGDTEVQRVVLVVLALPLTLVWETGPDAPERRDDTAPEATPATDPGGPSRCP